MSESNSRYIAEGRLAYAAGINHWDCPYQSACAARAEWLFGWLDAREERSAAPGSVEAQLALANLALRHIRQITGATQDRPFTALSEIDQIARRGQS